MKENDLHWLARTNALRELEEAIARGININEKDRFGFTPLAYAVSENQFDAVKLLLGHGADSVTQDSEGSTPLHVAAEQNLYQIADELIRRDARSISIADEHGNEPLWTAVFNARGRYDLVSLLLKHGADVNHRNNVGLSPLDMAKRIGDDALLKALASK